jgi:hypothetical protein
MDIDNRIQEAIANGERNKATIELIRNWCRHARISKFGGVGIVEAQTGLPIGHHAMACDHAVANGIAAWDLADAAIDFYDRNCAHCLLRVPVGLPNISALVAERDARRQRSINEKLVFQRASDQARNQRCAVRHALRAQLSAPSAGIVDCLDDLDQEKPGDASSRLLAIADMAPEKFSPPLIEYLYALLEAQEGWFIDTGLVLLRKLGSEPIRLTRCAVKELCRGRLSSIAAEIIERYAVHVDTSEIADALPALIELSSPEPAPFSYERASVETPLRALYAAHAPQVAAAIEALLVERNSYHVSLGAAGILVLAEIDKTIAPRFVRTLAAKLTGVKWTIDERRTGYAGDDPCIYRMQEALQVALEHATAETDVMIQRFLAGAIGDGEVRLIQVYARALRTRRKWKEPPAPSTPATRVAIKRLVAAGVTHRNKEVLTEVLNSMTHSSDDHVEAARLEFTALLGAAVLMDDELKRFDSPPPPREFLQLLEHQTARHQRVQLQGTFLKWAAEAANGSDSHIDQYLDVLAGIPEEREELRAGFIENCHPILRSPAGLNRMLPSLYASLVGASTRGRAAAASMIGKLGRNGSNDLPDLVFEAFTALLSDPYVLVHRSAVDALENFELPQHLNGAASAAVSQWINYYHVSREDDTFLVECIRLFLWRFASDASKKGKLGQLLMAILEHVDPEVLRHNFRWLHKHLRDRDEFIPLLLNLLGPVAAFHERADYLLNVLAEMPVAALQKHKSAIAGVGSAKETHALCAMRIIEVLTRGGAWDEAAQVGQSLHDHVPATTEHSVLKLNTNLDRMAARFEQALAHRHLEAIPRLASEWNSTVDQIKENQAKHAQQRSALPGLLSPH